MIITVKEGLRKIGFWIKLVTICKRNYKNYNYNKNAMEREERRNNSIVYNCFHFHFFLSRNVHYSRVSTNLRRLYFIVPRKQYTENVCRPSYRSWFLLTRHRIVLINYTIGYNISFDIAMYSTLIGLQNHILKMD